MEDAQYISELDSKSDYSFRRGALFIFVTNGTSRKACSFESLLHPAIHASSLKQFNDGHLREAVMNAVTAVYNMIRWRTKLELDGNALATQAFGLEKGKLILSELGTESGDNDQRGFMQIYQGIYTGIRSPKAHTLHHDLDPHKAAQYLVMMSLLARRVDESKNRSDDVATQQAHWRLAFPEHSKVN